MDDDRINVAIIGAGETGTRLLKQLVALDFVTVTGVSDLHATAPGMRLAEKHGILATRDYMDLVDTNDRVDVIVDVTGEKHVRQRLRSYLEKSGNRHAVIVNDVVARLLTSIGEGRLVERKHAFVGY
jgi:predicted homoserine dehydrogenase-like protein